MMARRGAAIGGGGGGLAIGNQSTRIGLGGASGGMYVVSAV